MPLTLNHKKEQLSLAYIRAVAATAGFSCTKPEVDDDSVDIVVACSGTYGEGFVMKSPRIEVQAKATEMALTEEDDCFKFPLPVKNYEDLRGMTLVPRILVVMIVPDNADDWLEQSHEHLLMRYSAYWVSIQGQPDTENETKVTVRIPKEQIFTVPGLQAMMERVARREPI